MENIETLLAAVAQTQGFDDDEPVGSSPRLVNSGSSPEIMGDVGGSQLAGAPLKVPGNTGPHVVVNPPPETSVSAAAPVERRRRGRRPKGQLSAKPPPRKRKKEQEEEGQLSAKPAPPKRKKEQEEEDEEDVCFICFDGGSLVLCDRKGCPKAYHPSCIKRDDAFFKSKAKWNCGWHICSVCRKASYYICYTCPYSLCKGCTKDAEYLRVRGNKGFCNSCMNFIMLIENKDQTSNESAVQVDLDDITSWEYLFKMYWVTLKEKLSLTVNDLTRAKKPWRGVASVACKPQLSTAVDRKVYIPNRSSGYLDSKLQEVHNNGLTTAQSDNAEGGPILDKDDKHINEEIITAEASTNKQVAEKALDTASIKDAADPGATDKPRDDPIEMPKLLECHDPVKKDSSNNSLITARFVGSLECDMEVDGNNSDQLMGIKSRKQETCENHEERATQNTSNKYAAIDVHNMNLIYLQRNLMANLIKDKENLLAKVVGSIVRIRISSDDQKPDVYRLVHVVGISKVAKPYKIGDKTADMTLEVLNLGKKEVVSVDAISNQEFTEAECRQLNQYIKCGLLKQYTLDEVQKKAMALQSVRFNVWLEAEVLRLYHLLDQASKKGCEEEVSEYVRRIQLLKSPEERQRRISEIPEIHADIETGPYYESEDSISGGNSTKDGHASPRCSRSPLSGKEPLSPKEKGTEEGPIHTQSKTVENIDASGLHGLEKPPNQVDITISAVSGGDDQAMVRPELETSTATDPIVNSLTDDNIEIEKLWHYRDCYGKIQGPFSMMHLRLSCTNSQFPPDMRIWTNHEQYDSLLLTDALNGKLHGASDLPHNFSSESREYMAINGNNGDSTQTDAAQSTSASVLSDNNGESKRAHESPLPKCWDLFKDKTTSAQDVPAYSPIPSSSFGQISMTTNLVQKCDEFNHVAEFTENNSSGSTQNETTYQSLASGEEKLIPLPIGLSLNDISPEPVAEPLSKSRDSVKQEVEIDVFNLPSPKHWGFPTAAKQQSESSSVQNSGFLELLSLKPRSDNEENEIRANENKQYGLVNLSVPYSGPSWSSQFNMTAGGMQFPEMASDWFGYSSTPAKQSDPIRPEVTSDNIVTSDNNQFAHVSSSHPASNTPSWLAMINEPIEFDAFGEESVSDLLAEVDAMESQGTLPSPTSAMKFAKELIQDCKDDCFSSIEDFSPTPDPGKSDDLSSTGEIQLSCQSSAPGKPISLIDALSGMHSSGSSTGETSAPVYTVEPGLGFHRGPLYMGQDMVGANMAPGMGPETSDPGWGSVQGNINLVTVQGNVNLVLGGPAQGMTNLGWGSNQGTTWGNSNINHNPINGSLPWDSQRMHSGERFTNGREWGYQGVETGFGRGRLPWGRPPYGGGGGYSRPLPKGQRVCKFYESGRCRKGAFCDYLHP